MSYTKIYYDDIWEIASKGTTKCNDWDSKIKELSKGFTDFVKSESFTGKAATNMKSYLEQVHGILISIIGTVIQSYSVHVADYYGGYTRLVDSGDGEEYGLRYTTIVNSEVCATGSVQSKLNSIRRTAEQVVIDANNVKSSISDLVSISAYPRTYNLYEQIDSAKSKAQKVHDNAISYEASRAHDFDEIDRLISQALSIINAQIGKSRIPVINYQQGSIGKMCNVEQILIDLEATSKKIKAIDDAGYLEDDVTLAINRDALIQEEEEASREWIQWVAVGIAVVGSVVLIAVTAGGATPLVCAGVGAAVGAVTAASSSFADNFVETGSFVDGMDWSEFGKDVTVGAVGGFVAGGLGAISQGSAIKQPIEKGMYALSTTVLKEGAEGVTATVWEGGETIYEVGEAIIAGKPGDEVMSVLDAGLQEAKGEMVEMFEDMAVEGAKAFVGGTVAGSFDVDTSDKSALRKIGEKTAEGVAEGLAGGAVKTTWEVGEAILDNDSSTTVISALKEGLKETVKDVTSSTSGAVVSGAGDSLVDKIDGTAGKVVGETVNDTISKTSEKVVGGVAGRTMDYVYGDEKDASKILGDIWEEDLDSGRSILKDAGESLGTHVSDAVNEDKKHYNDLKKIDYDHDGKIEVVQFDEYTVTKQDYDAAVENAGKGAYKDQTAQEILGLSRDTDLSSGKHQTVDIDYTQKHSNDNPFTSTVTVEGEDGKKYVFTKEYYDSTFNAAGTKEYEGRTVREMLDLPEDIQLKDNTTTDTVRTDSIGRGEDVELHKQSGTNATKIDISTTSRQEREKANKVAEEIAKELNKNIKNHKFEN